MTVQYMKTAEIGKDRYEWLADHPEVRFSELVRNAVDRAMQEEHESRCGTVE